jgi:hypothetical protein
VSTDAEPDWAPVAFTARLRPGVFVGKGEVLASLDREEVRLVSAFFRSSIAVNVRTSLGLGISQGQPMSRSTSWSIQRRIVTFPRISWPLPSRACSPPIRTK